MAERNVYEKPEDKVLLRTADVYQTEAEDEVSSYSDRTLAIVAEFTNSGIPEGCNGQSMVGKSKRGEVACRLFARIDPATGIIEAAGFKARGCLAMTACASGACTLIEGKGIEEALDVGIEDIREFVDGVPSGKVNSLHFAACAIQALVGDFLLREGASLQELDEAVPCDELSVSCIMAEHCSLRQSRLERRMEEAAAQREIIETNACAQAFDLIRRRTTSGQLTASKHWRELVPAHMTVHEFDELLWSHLEEGSDDPSAATLDGASIKEGRTVQSTVNAVPSPYASRSVGVPRRHRAPMGDAAPEEHPATQPDGESETKTVYEYGAAKAAPEEEEFELVPPEGYELVQVDGQWGLVKTDEERPPKKLAIDASGIKVMRGAKGTYLYDGHRMTPAYARWAFLGQEDDPLATFAYCVREDSRIYPRPMAESSFANEPLNMDANAVRRAFEAAQADPAYGDLCRTEASNGDVYYYSSDHLTAEHATSLAEWESVERLWNV